MAEGKSTLGLPERVVARFWSRVAVQVGQCWPWGRAKNCDGYGRFKITQQKEVLAHRLAFALTHERELQPGEVIRHACDNPACCNPAHLSTGTQRDNVRDRVERARSAKGHKNGRAKLTEAQVREILASPMSAAKVAARYGVSKGTITDIRSGRNWGWLQRRGFPACSV